MGRIVTFERRGTCKLMDITQESRSALASAIEIIFWKFNL